MPPIVLQLADGTAFFAGLGLFALCLFGLLFACGERRWLGYLWRLGAVAAATLTAFAMPPLPAALASLWVWGLPAGLLALFLIHGSESERLGTLARALGSLLLAFAGLLALLELPYHRRVRLPVPKNQCIYVVADSLSAGVGTGETVWPERLKRQTGLNIVNLAVPGAQAGDALQQTEGIRAAASLVLLEIGGNDFLRKTPAPQFRADLDRLLAAFRAKGARVAMFELPLPCFGNDLGRIQRELARTHGVILLPRSYLSKPLSLAGGTIDGLHLSQRGHDLLSQTVASTLEIESRP